MIYKNDKNIKEKNHREKVAEWINNFKNYIVVKIQNFETQLDAITKERNGLAKDLKSANAQLSKLKEIKKNLEDKIVWYEKVHQEDIERIKGLESKLDKITEVKESLESDLKINNKGREESKLIMKFKEELKQIGEELQEIEGEPAQSESTYPSTQSDISHDLSTARKGGFCLRFIAITIDSIIINVLSPILIFLGIIAMGLDSSGWETLDEEDLYKLLILLYLFKTIIAIAYCTYFHGSTGQTIGKIICRLKVVRVNGESLGYRKAFLRWIGYVISSFVFCLGFLWATWDKNKQAWHDKIAGTYVIKT